MQGLRPYAPDGRYPGNPSEWLDLHEATAYAGIMRTLRRPRLSVHVFSAAALLLAACGEPTPPAPPPQPSDTPSAAPAPPPPPASSAAPTASASASATAEAPPPKRSGGGGIAVIKSDPAEITDTFGSGPAKLELGEGAVATLRIPEGALSRAVNITFKIDARGKSLGPPMGKIYAILAVNPPSTTPEQVESYGPPFVIELPAGGKKDANLAIGADDGSGKPKWTVVAPKRIDDARNVAVFELTTLPSGWIHVTTKAPGATK
jgi:hypothetical protein